MQSIKREMLPLLEAQLKRGKSILLLGPRQVGKTTLIRSVAADLEISLMQTELRFRYERAPDALRAEVMALKTALGKTPLVFIDEIQLVPGLMNEIQVLIDNKIAQFILSGSSARKLKHQNHINLLPGRVVLLYLDPLSDIELNGLEYTLEDRLYFGSLPAIALEAHSEFRSVDLQSYVEIYLEDEVRREALVRNVAQFGRFLELAAVQSGEIINLSRISQDVGVAHTTISTYYQILQDCLIAKRVDPFTQSHSRRRLVQSPKYLFFDLGVRRIAAKEGHPLSLTQLGRLFEQWLGLEILKWINLHENSGAKPQLFFWRDNNGTEVDWVIKRGQELIPIEVKWTEHPSDQDIRHLKTFMKEYGCQRGFVVCRTPKPLDLGGGVLAINWAQWRRVLA